MLEGGITGESMRMCIKEIPQQFVAKLFQGTVLYKCNNSYSNQPISNLNVTLMARTTCKNTIQYQLGQKR